MIYYHSSHTLWLLHKLAPAPSGSLSPAEVIYHDCQLHPQHVVAACVSLRSDVLAVQRLFDESFYADLNGGILEGFGRLLRFNLKIYVYPTLDERTGKLVTASDVKV